MARSNKQPSKKPIPYGKIALLWANGKTVSQISDQMGWTKKGDKYPYSYAYNVLKTLRKGVSLGLVTVCLNKKRGTSDVREEGHSRKLICPICG
jgi:hypothetical protein